MIVLIGQSLDLIKYISIKKTVIQAMIPRENTVNIITHTHAWAHTHNVCSELL